MLTEAGELNPRYKTARHSEAHTLFKLERYTDCQAELLDLWKLGLHPSLGELCIVLNRNARGWHTHADFPSRSAAAMSSSAAVTSGSK